MGVDSNKNEILQIIWETKNKYITLYNTIYPKIQYNIKDSDKEQTSKNEIKNDENSDDDLDFYFYENQELNNPKLEVKNIKKYPYNSIGTISVQFPSSDEIFVYTCFLIDSNVVVTLASNLENKNKGGKAKLIKISFSKENVKWENIFIQEEEEKKK